ncbi:MAG: beta-glucuronidase, partial [Ruminococcus sp.]|nr:beta-glucuronidase [Ruminococcus sp.]
MTDRIDLSGEWRASLDENRTGTAPEYDCRITLPGTTALAGLGRLNERRETSYLTEEYPFEGDAWFSREVDLSPASGKTALLYLERTRMTELSIDGELIGRRDSLSAPHVYDISRFADGVHKLEIKVTNTGYPTKGGHLTSPDTQTNWNGITGEISVRIYDSVYAEEVRVTPLFAEKSFRIFAKIKDAESGRATVSAVSFNGKGKPHEPPSLTAVFTGGELLCTLPLGNDARVWDEYSPELYRISVTIGGDTTTVTAGLREFAASGRHFTINGRRTFLRGRHSALLFPKTGCAPTDLESWLRDMEICKSYGINHVRFHTCCPPEAAFEAADRLGIFLEPELPFWGTIYAPGEEGFDEREQNFLIAEGFRMLAEYGNHPSFVMMSLGNELWGSAERLGSMISAFRRFDSRHLYTQGSNNFQFAPRILPEEDFFVGVRLSRERLLRGSYAMCDAPLGHVQTEKPSTMHNYDDALSPADTASEHQSGGEVQIQFGTGTKTVKADGTDGVLIPEIPVITHEIGQYETFPDFDEIEKYTGVLKARNLEIFREKLESAGLLHLARDYFEASGALAVQCYKEELEAAFRTEGLAGFQLLDLQDFTGQGTALVGVLDAFMDEKGICSPEHWRQFGGDAVIMAEFPDYCLQGGSEFSAEIRLANFRPGIAGKRFSAKLICRCGNVKAEISGTVPAGEHVTLGRIETVLPSPDEPKRFRLELSVEETDISNSYELFVFPKEPTEPPEGLVFGEINSAAEKLLAEGRTILLARLPEQTRSVEGFYCTDFWCYPMFRSISQSLDRPEPVGTMGLLIDDRHPALAGFPTKTYSEPLWYSAVTGSRSEIISDLPNRAEINVIVRTIDNFETNRDLALMYEYPCGGGKVLVLNCDPENLRQTP